MWAMIHSLAPIVEALAPAFTAPSAATAAQLLLAWVMCLGKHTLGRVAENAHPDTVPDHTRRHGLDTCYNFFERSAWTPDGLARRLGVLILTRLKFGGAVTLLVDDTLAHKRGKSVGGLGWFRDAVASTQKRVATASGHNWAVPRQQTSPAHRGAAALVARGGGEGGAVGVVDAERGKGVVCDGRPRPAGGGGIARPDGGVGQ